jgi:hypothetical protein
MVCHYSARCPESASGSSGNNNVCSIDAKGDITGLEASQSSLQPIPASGKLATLGRLYTYRCEALYAVFSVMILGIGAAQLAAL